MHSGWNRKISLWIQKTPRKHCKYKIRKTRQKVHVTFYMLSYCMNYQPCLTKQKRKQYHMKFSLGQPFLDLISDVWHFEFAFNVLVLPRWFRWYCCNSKQNICVSVCAHDASSYETEQILLIFCCKCNCSSLEETEFLMLSIYGTGNIASRNTAWFS